jgi:hypothetical protein
LWFVLEEFFNALFSPAWRNYEWKSFAVLINYKQSYTHIKQSLTSYWYHPSRIDSNEISVSGFDLWLYMKLSLTASYHHNFRNRVYKHWTQDICNTSPQVESRRLTDPSLLNSWWNWVDNRTLVNTYDNWSFVRT